MDLRATSELLREIEAQYDVNSLSHRGVMVWPLVRFAIYDQLWKQANPVSPKGRGAEPTPRGSVPPRDEKVAASIGKAMSVAPKAMGRRARSVDILIHSRPEDHADLFPGLGGRLLAFDRYMDPIAGLASERFTVLKIEPRHSKEAVPAERYVSTMFFDPFEQMPERDHVAFEGKVLQLNDFNAFLRDIAPDIEVNEEEIRRKTNGILGMQPKYRQLLRTYKPKCVLLACYYSYFGLAMVKACRDLGIASVDVQHGQRGCFNAFSAWWTKSPSLGYELLPSHFWTWGQASSVDIVRGLPDGTIFPRTVLGGNPWLGLWVHGNGMPMSPDTSKFLESLDAFRRVVLVTLQPLSELIPKLLFEAIGRSPREWCWLIRLHPSTRGLAGELTADFQRREILNVEIEQSTSLPLYPLLRRADHHVTGWSSVCFESVAMGTPTTIVHPTGKELFADYIRSGLFGSAETAEALLSEIEGSRKGGVIPVNDPYILTDRSTTFAALEDCMRHDGSLMNRSGRNDRSDTVGITFFSSVKAFRGTTAIHQRNAIRSWAALGIPCEILLFGNDEGTREIAEEFGCVHVPDVEMTDLGTPLLSDMFRRAQELAAYDICCYINGDIILMDDFAASLQVVARWRRDFVMIGHRWDVDMDDAIDMRPGWQQQWRERWISMGKLHSATGHDYFAFRRGLLKGIPPFAIGRPVWDNWLVMHICDQKIPLIDATECVLAVHPNHGYGHVKAQRGHAWQGPEADSNMALARRSRSDFLPHCHTIQNATWLLTANGPTRALTWKHLNRRGYVWYQYSRLRKEYSRLRRAIVRAGRFVKDLWLYRQLRYLVLTVRRILVLAPVTPALIRRRDHKAMQDPALLKILLRRLYRARRLATIRRRMES